MCMLVWFGYSKNSHMLRATVARMRGERSKKERGLGERGRERKRGRRGEKEKWRRGEGRRERGKERGEREGGDMRKGRRIKCGGK